MLDLEKFNNVLNFFTIFGFFLTRAGSLQGNFKEARVFPQATTSHDVVKYCHALEKRDVLEGPRDTNLRCAVRRHL